MNADGMDLQPSSIWTRNNSTALTAANRNEASSHVCERCSSWKLDRLFEPYEGSISARITRAELLESYDKACPFCEDLRAIFTQLNPDDNSSKSTDSIIIRQRLGAQDEPKWRTFSEFDLQGEALGKIPLLPLIDHESSPKFPFTHVTRIREPFVDYGAMRQWISCCKVNHKKCALPAPQPNHKDLEIYRRGFRAIDCVKKKFENVSGPEQFVALSYVWAQVPEQPNEQVAGRLPQILPQLIEDARIVTLELGIRFLWVDRYCITQSDPEEKQFLIQRMDTIYKHAVLTIVAAMDENAPLGLPGVSVPRSKPRVFSFGQHTLLRTPDPRKTITASKWQTRGWTYQEMLLSRYRLVFTSDQVYFQCAMASCIEGQRVPEMEHFEYQVFPDPLIDKNINTLYDRIEEYSRRELSFDTDTINALIGVFNVYRESSSTVDSRGAINHFYGVPISWRRCSGPESWCASMTLGLDWRVGEKDVKKRECFPSWSWTSVKTFHLLFAGRSRDMKGVPESHDIEVKLTRLDGTMVDLATFLVDPQIDYTHFQPWIDVTTWGFSTPKNESAFGFLESNCGAQVLENRYQRYWNVAGACIFLDYPGYQPRGRLTLIHIRLIDSNGREPVQSSSLIVEEVIAGSGQFKRVGRYLQCLGREMELSDYYNMSAPKFLDTYLDWDGEPKKMPPWEIIKLRLV